MSQTRIDTPHGVIDAEIVRPEGTGPWPGVVVVHDVLGMSDDLREITRNIAAAGYLAAAPRLADGSGPRCLVSLFRDFHRGQGTAFDRITASREHLKSQPDCTARVGVVGFCIGGGFALATATDGFDASAPFYGELPKNPEEALRESCPVVGSFGRRDPALIGAGDTLAAALSHNGIPHDVKTYPGVGHGFANHWKAGPLTPILRVTGFGYQQGAAEDAWRRVFAFFDTHLRGGER
ncbi:dienelactone hydrolase family protein [Nocardia sp. NPDC052254]|uniref:dienelactone hydrolase family protein n=1 Tax=Nocardia sp. NPDC052254 TaxID=3155681 RepID=UPI00342DCD91